jgi:plastocyanin
MRVRTAWSVALFLFVTLFARESRAACVPSATTFCITSPTFGFTVSGTTGVNPTLTLTAGVTYTFDYEGSNIHTLEVQVAPAEGAACAPGASPCTPVTTGGTITFTPTTGSYGYWCNVHAFGGTLVVLDAPDGGADAGEDAGLDDAGQPDAGLPDAGAEDAGVADSGVMDAGATADAGLEDAGGADAGPVNAADAGNAQPQDSGASSPDAGPAGAPSTSGCGCGQGFAPLAAAAFLLLAAAARARRRHVPWTRAHLPK